MSQSNSPKQLLLLNTNQERREAIENLLSQGTKFSLLIASNVRDALTILKTESVDFIVSNINLDNFDGWRLARMVRSGVLNCSAQTPFVVVANTWCEHLASATAREFGINRLIAFSEHHLLLDIINNEQLEKIEDMEKARLLVIEDNPDTLHLVTRILANRFVIDTANNGEKGLKLFQDNDYALVLLDVMLPGMSGNQVLDAIMSNKSNQSVVIMTANHTMALAEELMLNGAADFITKPFRSEQLRRVCETATRREDFMISNRQFADKVKSLNASRIEYRKISEQHQQLLDQLGSIIIELDEQGRIVFINKAWHTYTGFSIAETQHKSLLAFIKTSANSDCNVSQKFSGLLSGKANTLSIEFQLKNKFHEEIWVEARFVLASDDENKSKRISGTIDNITSRKKSTTRPRVFSHARRLNWPL
jgi:PAS domain S-box-containing protein